MTNSVEGVWAAQQARPAIRPPFRQPTEWGERHQIVVLGNGGRYCGTASQMFFDDPYKQTQPNRYLADQLPNLQREYTIVDSEGDVIELLAEHSTLFRLLVDAVQPLKSAFGENRLFLVRVQHSEYDSLLEIAVQLPADFPDPETALRSFDTGWWVNNCQRSCGALVFDYEIQDAV